MLLIILAVAEAHYYPPRILARGVADVAAVSLFVAPVHASPTAAQISLDSLPPSAVSVEIDDLPFIGSLVSGTYARVDKVIDKASVTIKSPKDKVKAIQGITNGHLEFDVSGILATHLDVDVAADDGVARIRVASPLIPKLPFKGKSSPWKMVTDMGNGASYYYNEQTGTTQYDPPPKP
ncbi:hypothetical protein CTAYLR_005757 [Chrysophaeum taylorii]|uniref:WW domain-containing protein n=1 Tax=Chrysophaeum taylorii TaxID=2483200 RepID=A0AAD7UIS5_9STRA|nr:hypothetical protein CTAYLR_005757 [Chrysophaeum taylorii]